MRANKVTKPPKEFNVNIRYRTATLGLVRILSSVNYGSHKFYNIQLPEGINVQVSEEALRKQIQAGKRKGG